MGFGSSRHAFANGHCDSDGYFYCHSYGNCGANRFFATEQSDRNSDRDGYSDSYGNGDIHCYGHGDSYSYRDGYCYGNRYTNGHSDAYTYADTDSQTHAFAKNYARTKAAGDSPASAVTGDDELVERVVLRKGACSTLNALGDITAASPYSRAFGVYLSSSSEKPIHIVLMGSAQDFS